MTYQEFLNSSPRILSQLNRMNEIYEKKILFDIIEQVMPGEKEEEEVIYEDDLSMFF